MNLKLKILFVSFVSYFGSFMIYSWVINDFSLTNIFNVNIYIPGLVSITGLIIPVLFYMSEKSKSFYEEYDNILSKVFKSKCLNDIKNIEQKELPMLRKKLFKIQHTHEYEHVKEMVNLRKDLLSVIES